MAKTRNEVETVFVGKDKTSDDIKRIQKNLGGLQKTTQKFGAFMRSPAGLIGTAIAGVAAINKMTGSLGGLVDGMAEVGRMSEQLGVSTEFLSELDFAAKQANIPIEQLRIGIQRFGRRAAEASKGTGEAKDAFRELGIELNFSDGRMRSIERLLPEVAQALGNTATQGDRLRLAFKLFDSEGVKLLRILPDTIEGFNDLRDAASGAGATISQQQADDAQAYSDAMGELAENFKAVGRSLTGGALPAINKWLEELEFAIQIAKAGGLKALGDEILSLGVKLGKFVAQATGFAQGFEAVRDVMDPFQLRQFGSPDTGPAGRVGGGSLPGADQAAQLTANEQWLLGLRDVNAELFGIESSFESIIPKSMELGEITVRAAQLSTAEWNAWRETMNTAGQEGRDAMLSILPALDAVIDKLFEAESAGASFGDVLKGAAVGFLTGGPAGAAVGAAVPFINQVGRGGNEVRG